MLGCAESGDLSVAEMATSSKFHVLPTHGPPVEDEHPGVFLSWSEHAGGRDAWARRQGPTAILDWLALSQSQRPDQMLQKALVELGVPLPEQPESLLELLLRERHASRETIRSLQSELELRQQRIARQNLELVEKERVIQSLAPYRSTSLRYWLGFAVPRAILTSRPLHPLVHQVRLAKRAWMDGFRLHQYSPRPLRLPAHYPQAAPPCPAPSLTLVTPTRNQAAFLEATLESVLTQGYPNLEYVVQDGASTDATPAILDAYRHRLARVDSREDRGQAHAINLGFEQTRGELMAWVNSDDLLLPGTLNYVASYFHEHPEVDVVYGHRVIIDPQGREIGRWVLPPHDPEVLSWADYVPQETLFWRRSLWDRAGGVQEDFHFAMDWDLLLRFRKVGGVFARLPRFLGAFRVHSCQKTSQHLDTLGSAEMERIRSHLHGRRITQQEASRRSQQYVSQAGLYHLLYRLGLLRY